MAEPTTQEKNKILEQFLIGANAISQGEDPGLDYDMLESSLLGALEYFPPEQQEEIKRLIDTASLQNKYHTAQRTVAQLKPGSEQREAELTDIIIKYTSD